MDSTETSHCRLCAELKSNDKLVNVQTDEEQRREINDKLARINIAIDWYLDIFPKTVCFVCLNALNKAYTFVNNIEKAQELLNEVLTVQNIKKELPLSDDESCGFDAHDDVKSEDEVDVKLELPKTEIDLDFHPSEVESTKKDNLKKQKKRPRPSLQSSLDAIPLAQLKLTWKDFTWTCAYCETQFLTADELKIHSMEYHKCCNAYRCTNCNLRKLRLDSFIIHIKRHRNYLKLSCYKCFRKFPTTREVNIHIKSHKTTANVCPGCNTSFDSAEQMIEHSTMFYQDRRSRKIPILEVDTENLTCLLCNKSFKHKGSLSTHLLTHTERKRDHTCDKCGKCFLSKQNLEGHMLLHSDTRPYQCEICKYAFKTPQQLRNHVGVHDGHKPYSCDQCGRCFRLQKQLVSHSIIHTDLMPHICSYCNKGFRFKTILNQHIRQHTGLKPYTCEICQRDFTNWPNYNKHMKRRHGMDMAKKKHTPEGVYPINPATGEVVVYPETNKTIEWKKKMLEQRQRKPGRPKMKKQEVPSVSLEEIKGRREERENL